MDHVNHDGHRKATIAVGIGSVESDYELISHFADSGRSRDVLIVSAPKDHQRAQQARPRTHAKADPAYVG